MYLLYVSLSIETNKQFKTNKIMKTLNRIPVQLKAMIIAALIISITFIAMINSYGFQAW